jgi:uncharacterized protein YjgD (DUF1641 family)
MAEPIRIYTPRHDAREELRRKIEAAPVDHAEALLSAYELLQEANDHGVLDALRGAIGAGEAIIGKASEYANTPEGVRLLRNLLAITRVLGAIDPALLDATAKALARSHRNAKADSRQPSLLQTIELLTGPGGRRALAMMAGFIESFGGALNPERVGAGGERSHPRASGVAVPVVFSAAVILFASFWIGRRSSSH